MVEYVYALHDFPPEHEDEVSFHSGERIEVVERDDLYRDGWWKGRNLAGKVGLFPQSYTTTAPPATNPAAAPSIIEPPLQPLPEELDSVAVSPVSPVPQIQLGADPNGEVMKATMTDVQKAIVHPSSLLMSSHYDSLPDEVPFSKLCSLSVEIRLNFGIPSPRSVRRRRSVGLPPPYSKNSEAQQGHEDSQVVRRGPVHVEEYGAHARNWYFSTNWLVLTDNNLSMHRSAGQAPRTIISITDIAKLERTEVKSHGLILETKQGKKYLLTFKNDDDLYGWQDTICLHSVGVSNPWNFKHNVHVAVDPSNGNYYTGLPDEWRKVLSYPQGKMHPKFARPLPADVPTDVSKPLNLLRITLNNPARSTFNNPRDPGHLSTTLSVTPDMCMGDILDRVCAKMRLEPTSCALALPGDSNGKPLSLDDTVEDLHGKDNLVLVTL